MATSTVDAAALLRQIEQCQTTLTEQQRVLLRAPDELARATALRSTGILVRQLDELRQRAQELGGQLQAQAAEQERRRTLQEVGAAINSAPPGRGLAAGDGSSFA